MKRVKRLLLCLVVAGGATLYAVPHASACTGDVCDGLCDFMNANPKIFKNGCQIR